MKYFLLTTAIVFSSMQVFSQVHVGLSTGTTITTFREKEEYSSLRSTALAGFNIGAPLLLKLNKNIGFESGLFYVNMGSTEKIKPEYYDPNDPVYLAQKGTTYYYRLNYLSLPLTFNYGIPIKKYAIYAKAGGYFSYMLNGKIKNDQSKDEVKIDINNGNIYRSDLGILFGLGVTRELGNGFLFFDARYMLGCTKLNTSQFHLYNRGLLLNIGYMLSLGK